MADCPTILVTGGAGYIGGQTVLALLDQGFEIVVIDNLSTGRYATFLDQCAFYQCDVGARREVRDILNRHRPSAVLHFAASISVDESVAKPYRYFSNNVAETVALIDEMRAAEVDKIIFSSTAAVYGDHVARASEQDRPMPTTPYGLSKLQAEKVIQRVASAGHLNYGIFRYFNVAGADIQARHGPQIHNAKHLVGRIIAAMSGAEPVKIFGDDYPTRDGTGVRDYIHVCDVAVAHVGLLTDLLLEGEDKILNLGYGHGYSVKEMISHAEAALGARVPSAIVARRPGDVAEMVAECGALTRNLSWRPGHNDVGSIFKTAYAWRQRELDRAGSE